MLRSQAKNNAKKAQWAHYAKEKTFLRVPYADRNKVREAGARWDREKRAWYAATGRNLDDYKPWLTDATKKKLAQESPEWVQVRATPERRAPGERLVRIVELENQRVSQGKARKSYFKGCRFTVDGQGVVLVTLASGGMIRDAGDKIFFSKDTKEAARVYAGVKFGGIQVRGNIVEKQKHGISKWKKRRRNVEANIRAFIASTRNSLRELSQRTVAGRGED